MSQLMGQAILVGLSQLFVRGGLIVAFLIFARNFDAESFAALGYFNISLIAIVGTASLGSASLATKYFTLSDQGEADRRNLAALLLLMGAAAMSAGIVGILLPSDMFANLGKGPLFLVLMLAVLGATAAGGLVGRQAFVSLAWNGVLTVVIMLSLAWVAGRYGEFVWAAIAVVMAYGGKALLDLLALARHLDLRRPDAQAWRQTIAAVAAMAGSSAIWALGMWGIATVVLSRLGVEAFAIYVVGIQWYAIGMFLAASLTRALMPRQVEAARRGEDSRLVRPAMLWAMGVAALLAMLAWSARPWIDLAYGSALTGLGDILWLFIAASISVAPANMLSNQLIAEGREVQWLWAAIGWAVMLAIGLLLALPYGLAAVVISLIAANLAMVALARLFLRKSRAPCPA